MTTRAIGSISGDQDIKDYYIEYRNGNIDTLYVDYSDETPASNCQYIRREVRYNGKKAELDSNYSKTFPVYNFDKP
ncbi:hypothetical protein [Chitinophaga polysaccharea]|uniref:hypothetical protein n=1 Tax=Chitinophaga polysaccharea TaxID=1293035 RepID=UPI001159867F|nr:hypothetical protein [Chitinophaga polysaccharea]